MIIEQKQRKISLEEFFKSFFEFLEESLDLNG